MSIPGSVGFFGKLPGMGDFVQRRLPGAFVSVWDTRFEAAVGAARAAFGDSWHGLWQGTPVWRFALMPGVCGVTAWVGVTGPSVDRVGRSFPMVLATPLTDAGVFGSIVRSGAGWFDALEHACRDADATPTAESFDATVMGLPAPVDWLRAAATARAGATDWAQAVVWRMPWSAGGDDAELAAWLAVCMETDDGCLWWTHGSPHVPASAVLTHGLPRPADYAAFLDATQAPGDWRTLGALAAPSPSPTPAPSPRVVASPAAGTATAPDAFDDMLDGLISGAPAAPPVVSAAPVAASLIDEWVGPAPPAEPPPAPAPVHAPAPVAAAIDDDPDRTVVPIPAQPGARPPPLPATPGATGVAFVQSGGTAVLAADNGAPDARRQAALRAAALLDELGSRADTRRWCEQLQALHPALRERTEDLLDPIPEDGAVVVARVAGGQAAVVRVGAASAWHWRRGQLRPLFDDGAAAVPLDQADTARPDDLASMLATGTRTAPAPGLGTAGEPRCEEMSCLVAAGDRLLLLATDTLVRVPAQALAAALAATTGEEARAQIAAAASLGADRRQWPVAVIEVGT